jgi:hypothetical protein
MTKKKSQLNESLKLYQILILGCILSSLLILNSNFVVNEKRKDNLNEEKRKLFDKIISKRLLEGDETNANEKPLEGSDKVCDKGSDKLKKYYKSGDLKDLGLKEDEDLKYEGKGEPYFDSLINIIKSALGGKEEGESGSNSETGGSGANGGGEGGDTPGGGGGRILQDMDISSMQEDIITYAKHVISIVVFFVIGILSLPGWLICCFCCCCNCCCCCCCKKPGCKIPCFIFTYIFYALSIAICIYSLAESNKIFVGIADTECSILKFFDQVLEGELKETLPRWAGIQGINQILENISSKLNGLEDRIEDNLNVQIDNIERGQSAFDTKITGIPDKFKSGGSYLSEYSKNYASAIQLESGYTIEGTYVLDLIKLLGEYQDNKFKPEEKSFLWAWNKEYNIISEEALNYLTEAKESFESIVEGNIGDIQNSLYQGKQTLNQLKDSFSDITSEITDPIIDYSDLIDNYGKLGFKLVFGVLALMNIALAALVLLICFCSGKMCTNCCCCRCICKLFTHLLWNILALLMFITFMIGFLFSLIGTIGYDAMSVISFVVSKDNLGENGEKILVDKLGDAASYLDKCINGNGEIVDIIGIDPDDINSFNEISLVENQIKESKQLFEDNKKCLTYERILTELNERTNLTNSNLMLIKADADIEKVFEEDYIQNNLNKYFVFKDQFGYLNNNINAKSIQESWDINSNDETKKCFPNSGPDQINDNADIAGSSSQVFNPRVCKPIDRDWIYDIDPATSSNDACLKGRAEILSDTIDLLNNVKNAPTEANRYLKIITDLKDDYLAYLQIYITALDSFEDEISGIFGSIKQYINDDDSLFSFIKCNFIGTNLKVMLEFLKSALGKDIKTVGICLIIVGCSLALSISSTILLIVVINTGIDQNKLELKQEEMNKIPEYQLSSGGRVVQYKY